MKNLQKLGNTIAFVTLFICSCQNTKEQNLKNDNNDNNELTIQNHKLTQEIENLTYLLDEKLQSLCDTMTAEEKLKWKEYQKFELSAYKTKEGEELDAWQKWQKSELDAWQKKEQTDTDYWVECKKKNFKSLIQWKESEPKEFTEYAVLRFLRGEELAGMETYQKLEVFVKNGSQSMKMYLDTERKNDGIRNQRGAEIENEYASKRAELESQYQKKEEEANRKYKEVCRKKKIELGI